ncbi:MAG: hypothetical protein J6X34_04650 [Clostridia bacterium]|nr:hypothetical protein [Clostridia bacterium]
MKKKHELFGPFIMMIICAVLTVVIVSTGITLAYLKDRDDVNNVMTLGETEIEIEETFPPRTSPPYPGEPVIKVVKIENTGNLTCTVRARLVFSESKLEKMTEPLEIGEDWILRPDGFYYYMIPLKPGEVTKPLIEKVVFRRSYSNGGAISQEDIAGLDPELIVYSEALEFVKEDASLPEAEEILNNWNQY